MTVKVDFVTVRSDHAQLLLDWRTRPDITANMFTDIEPNLDRQLAWIEERQDDPAFIHYVIRLNGQPVGYLCFDDIDLFHRRCSSGSYIADVNARNTVFHGLHTSILDYVFYRLKLHKIINSFMDANKRMIRIQQILKYNYIGRFRDHILKNGTFHDVHYFEMTRNEWEESGLRTHPFEKSVMSFDDWSAE